MPQAERPTGPDLHKLRLADAENLLDYAEALEAYADELEAENEHLERDNEEKADIITGLEKRVEDLLDDISVLERDARET